MLHVHKPANSYFRSKIRHYAQCILHKPLSPPLICENSQMVNSAEVLQTYEFGIYLVCIKARILQTRLVHVSRTYTHGKGDLKYASYRNYKISGLDLWYYVYYIRLKYTRFIIECRGTEVADIDIGSRSNCVSCQCRIVHVREQFHEHFV